MAEIKRTIEDLLKDLKDTKVEDGEKRTLEEKKQDLFNSFFKLEINAFRLDQKDGNDITSNVNEFIKSIFEKNENGQTPLYHCAYEAFPTEDINTAIKPLINFCLQYVKQAELPSLSDDERQNFISENEALISFLKKFNSEEANLIIEDNSNLEDHSPETDIDPEPEPDEGHHIYRFLMKNLELNYFDLGSKIEENGNTFFGKPEPNKPFTYNHLDENGVKTDVITEFSAKSHIKTDTDKIYATKKTGEKESSYTYKNGLILNKNERLRVSIQSKEDNGKVNQSSIECSVKAIFQEQFKDGYGKDKPFKFRYTPNHKKNKGRLSERDIPYLTKIIDIITSNDNYASSIVNLDELEFKLKKCEEIRDERIRKAIEASKDPNDR